MFRRLKWFIAAFNPQKTPKPKGDTKLLSLPREHHNFNNSRIRNRKSMLEAVREVAIYIHRFHNLDLFQQGCHGLSEFDEKKRSCRYYLDLIAQDCTFFFGDFFYRYAFLIIHIEMINDHRKSKNNKQR